MAVVDKDEKTRRCRMLIKCCQGEGVIQPSPQDSSTDQRQEIGGRKEMMFGRGPEVKMLGQEVGSAKS